MTNRLLPRKRSPGDRLLHAAALRLRTVRIRGRPRSRPWPSDAARVHSTRIFAALRRTAAVSRPCFWAAGAAPWE